MEVLLAAWKSGAAYLPLDPEFPETRVQHILNEAKPALIIHNDKGKYYISYFVNSLAELKLYQKYND